MSETEAPSLSDRLKNLPGYTVPAILLGVPLLAILVGKLYPPFYDNVLWQYYWGPIKADALRQGTLFHNGVAAEPGYNLVNTLSWAVLMGLCLGGLTQLLTALKVRMTNALILGATAWTVTGAIFHVMQDTLLFARPLEYFFITPPIYLLFALGGIVGILTGWYMAQVAREAGLERGLQKLWFIQVIGVLLYTLVWAADWDQVVAYISPLHVALFAALNHFLIRWWVLRTDRIAPGEITLMLALTPFLMAIDWVLLYLAEPWSRSSAGMPMSAVWAPLLAAALAGMVYGVAKWAQTGLATYRYWIAGMAVVLVGVLMWATEETLTGTAVLGFVALAAVLAGIGVWVAHLMRTRADILAITGLGLAVLAGILVLKVVLERILGRFGLDLGIWALVASAVVVVAYLFQKRETLQGSLAKLREQGGASQTAILAYLAPINLVLIFSQMVDGFATSIGLDLAGYTEKHILSAFVIDSFRDFAESIGWAFGAANPTFLAFAPLKFLVSVLVVFAIDVFSKEDVENHPTFIGFVKFAIIMVGIGPGVRDFVRLALGV